MSALRRILLVVGFIAILGVANLTIWQRQNVVDHGALLLLELRPVDPRSLMQGDFMRLRYAERVFPPAAERGGLPNRGSFIVRIAEDGAATFARLDDGSAVADAEHRLKYKQVDDSGRIRLGAESFFFQEGQAGAFDQARYGALRVDESGNSVLVGLAGEDRQLISAAAVGE